MIEKCEIHKAMLMLPNYNTFNHIFEQTSVFTIHFELCIFLKSSSAQTLCIAHNLSPACLNSKSKLRDYYSQLSFVRDDSRVR